MRKMLLLLMAVVCSVGHLVAQSRVVTGKVTDSQGSPIPNVSVLIKGSNTGTTTNSDGNFSLSVPENARILVFSSIGLETQEISIGRNTNLDVTLVSTDLQLQEVIVVGYGTQRRADITGNVATVKGTQIANLPVQSFDASLGGRAAGVQITVPNGLVNNPPVFRIRGTNSINLSSYPLIVIDGVPSYTGDISQTFATSNVLSSVNPNDIESIEILKDASSAAIYGSRAANGVVLITTKKGKSGKAKVTYDGWVGVTSPYGLWDLLNAEQYMMMKNEGLDNAGNTTNRFLPTNGPDGKPIDTDWYDFVYRDGTSHSHNVNISGGSQGTTYYFSLGYTNQEGILVKNDFARKTARMNVDHKVNKVISLGGNFSLSNEITRAPNSGSIPGYLFSTAGLGRAPLVTAPNVGAYNNDGSYNISGSLIGVMNNQTGQVGFYNPAPVVDLNRGVIEGNRILGNFYLQIKPLEWITLRSTYGVDNLNTENELFYSPVHGDGFPRGNATSTSRKDLRWNWANTAQIDQSFGDHNLSLLGGTEQQYTRSSGFGLSRLDIADPFYTDIQGSYLTPGTSGLVRGENYLLSYFGRFNYDYNKKYFLSINARADEYSAFAPGYKKGNFWGASAGWDISIEGFWESAGLNNIFNSFRIRGSYGTVGNIGGIGNFASYSFYSGGLYGAAGTLGFSQAGNSTLQWETSKKTDIGLNFSVLDSRLSFELAYYRNNVDGLIYNVPQAPSRGIPGNSLLQNVGSMYNKGVEIALTGTPIRGNDFNWTSSFNITFNKNEVTALAPGITEFTSASDLETANITRVGHPVGALFITRTDGVNPDNGNRIFINKDGDRVQYQHVVASGESRWKYMDGTTAPGVGSQDAILYGQTNPKYYGGFDNNFRFKNFDLNILMTFQGGNLVYNGTQAGLRDQRFWNNHTDVLNRWTKPGDQTNIPKVFFGDNISNGSSFPISENVEKGDFVKLRNISFGYYVPASAISRLGFSSLRVYVSGQNMAIFSKYSGPDPEVSSNGNGNTNQGIDRNSIANGRTLTFGLNVGF